MIFLIKNLTAMTLDLSLLDREEILKLKKGKLELKLENGKKSL